MKALLPPVLVTLALLLPSPVAGGDFGDCSSGYRSIAKHIVRGNGQANIAAQCRNDENPCPLKAELIRRATLVSNAYALANIRSKVETEISHTVEIIDGVGDDRLTMKVGGSVFDIVFCNIEVDGNIRTLSWGEIKE